MIISHLDDTGPVCHHLLPSPQLDNVILAAESYIVRSAVVSLHADTITVIDEIVVHAVVTASRQVSPDRIDIVGTTFRPGSEARTFRATLLCEGLTSRAQSLFSSLLKLQNQPTTNEDRH